jgi:hypothetical protein
MANVIERIQPIAQTFSVTNTSGIYITKVGLFFSAKAADDDYPVQLHIRPTLNGVPDIDVILENSVVFKGASEVSVSADASLETTFTFEEPVFLEGNKDYAIVVQSNALADSYQLYTSKLGNFVLGSTTKRIQTDPYAGVFFKSSNGSVFEPDQTRDMTFKLYKATFSNTTATVRLNAAPPPSKLLDTDPFLFTTSDATLRVFHNNHGFQVNDVVTLSADSDGITTSSTINGVLGSSILGERTITAIDGTGYTLEMDSTADSAIFGGGSGILATQQYIMNAYRPNIEIQQPLNTNIFMKSNLTSSKSYAGTETPLGEISEAFTNNKEETYLKNPYVIATELRDTNLGRSSMYIDVILSTSERNYVAPVVDLQRAAVTTIHNVIDNQDSAATVGYNVPLNYVSETDPYFGSALAKHLTTPVILAEPATGIKVLVDVNRPSSTDFDVYYRTLETGADYPIQTLAWTEASKVEPSSNHNNVPTDTDYNLFREYRYTIGGDYVGALTPFSSYQIKIVMHSTTSSSKVPRFKALRTIALGT